MCREPLVDAFKLDAVVKSYLSHPRAAELGKISTALEGATDVPCERTDVRSFATTDMYLQLHGLWRKRHHVYKVYSHLLGLQLDSLAGTFQLVSAVAVYLTCAVRRGHLIDVANKLLKHLINKFAGDVSSRIGGVDLVFHVVTGRCGAELQCCGVLL